VAVVGRQVIDELPLRWTIRDSAKPVTIESPMVHLSGRPDRLRPGRRKTPLETVHMLRSGYKSWEIGSEQLNCVFASPFDLSVCLNATMRLKCWCRSLLVSW